MLKINHPSVDLSGQIEDSRHIRVKIKNNDYDVVVGNKISQKLLAIVNAFPSITSIVLISNKTVFDLYGDRVLSELKKTGLPLYKILIPDGERFKNLRQAEKILNTLIDLHIDRQGFVLSLGGGVIGDIAGFIASTYLRGIRFAQIPTTLLCAVDASVGGKVAVNLTKGKNMMGAFYQPKFIFSDIHYFQTLPRREYLCGLSEVIKHGLIGDRILLKTLYDNIPQVLSQDESILRIMVERSVRYKAKIVSMDEREKGLRAILNFGHTIGHAIESFLNYKKINHGEAISIGMVSALLLSERILDFSSKDLEKAISFIRMVNLPLWLEKINIEGILDHLKYDKKRKKDEIHFVLLKKIGQAEFGIPIQMSHIKEILKYQADRFSKKK